MTKTPKKDQKSLTDADISTARPARRAFLGLMAAGGGAAIVALTPTNAQAADIDNGSWTDNGACPRGSGGVYSGYTDSDNGNLTDAAGYGRGAPYC
ncbi:hypothetical protein [Nioella nitratireducens]|uniref:hypothetical protein n=1 Tax=Nioella nitratireducens TaxID=1287720 RepID=UPI0008FD36D9|nr:hypothetical protein [Nioella nitratireducens]